MNNDYSDIINFEYPYFSKHKKMTLEERSAQFGAFQALNGYNESIIETGRLVSDSKDLNEDLLENLDLRLDMILKNNFKVKIEYFIKDKSKNGGSYKIIEGYIKKVNLIERYILINNEIIKIDNIIDIKSENINNL